MTKQEKKQFKKELKALLKKYDADICISLEGDTFGIHDEQILIKIKGEIIAQNETGNYWFSHKDIV